MAEAKVSMTMWDHLEYRKIAASVDLELPVEDILVTCGGNGTGDMMNRQTRLRLRCGDFLVEIVGTVADVQAFVDAVGRTKVVL